MTTLYQDLIAAGIPTDHHEGDLYARCTPDALALVRASGHSYSLFIDAIDHEQWIDLPFAYTPYWDAVQARAKARLGR